MKYRATHPNIYRAVKEAIENRRSLTGRYGSFERRFSPHILGKSDEGQDCLVGFQYGGGRPGGLPPLGDWCFFMIDGLHHVRANLDTWRMDQLHARPDYLVTQMEVCAFPNLFSLAGLTPGPSMRRQ